MHKVIPILPYLLIAAALFSSLGLFLALKRDIRLHVDREKTRIEEMLVRLNDAERPAVTLESAMPLPAPLRAGINVNKRIHAIRMLRRGEDIAHIAAALGVPRSEVELMVRVQSLSKARAAAAAAD